MLITSTGGHFKGRDPTVATSVLQSKWVEESAVLYVGKAGGEGVAATLHSRLGQYLRFGEGKPIGHWGGRYIWQITGSGRLLVAWKPTGTESPVAVEQRMLAEFVGRLGKLPFANCRH